MFTIGAFLKEQPWAVQIKNFESRSHWDIGSPLAKFHTTGEQIKNEPQVFVWGAPAVSLKDFHRLREVIKKRPRHPDDYHGLLAKINAKAAAHPKYGDLISPTCITSYLPPAGLPVKSKTHGERLGQAGSLRIPAIFRGVDLTDGASLTMELFKTVKDGKPMGESTLQEKLEEVARRSTMPENRLRRRR